MRKNYRVKTFTFLCEVIRALHSKDNYLHQSFKLTIEFISNYLCLVIFNIKVILILK